MSFNVCPKRYPESLKWRHGLLSVSADDDESIVSTLNQQAAPAAKKLLVIISMAAYLVVLRSFLDFSHLFVLLLSAVPD